MTAIPGPGTPNALFQSQLVHSALCTSDIVAASDERETALAERALIIEISDAQPHSACKMISKSLSQGFSSGSCPVCGILLLCYRRTSTCYGDFVLLGQSESSRAVVVMQVGDVAELS
jgi:hypothetical protein